MYFGLIFECCKICQKETFSWGALSGAVSVLLCGTIKLNKKLRKHKASNNLA